jgi:DNA-binding GntR family transcriptional regulator
MSPFPFQPRRYPALCGVLGEDIVDPGRRSRADEAHDRILLRIIRGDWSAGTELKSTRIAAELGMSRTPVIQALDRLAAAGILHQALNQRAWVRPGAENWLVDLHRTRQLLEPEAARHAAGRVPEPVLDDLRALAGDAEPGRHEGWQRAARWLDQALHLVLAEFCGNLALRGILRRCWSYKQLSYEAGEDSDAHLREGWEAHVGIIRAVASGDGAEAERLMEAHLRAAGQAGGGGRIV